jgi:hypothetical protein
LAAAYSAAVGDGAAAHVVLWSAKINQVIAGCSDGATRVFYDPRLSTHGALLSTARAPRRRTVEDWAGSAAAEASGAGSGFAPGADMQGASKRSRRDELAQRAAAAAASAPRPAKGDEKPDFMLQPKRSFTDHLLAASIKSSLRAEDPQRVLQQYAAKATAAGSAGYLVAYASTQPTPILATLTLEQEIEQEERARAARRVGPT